MHKQILNAFIVECYTAHCVRIDANTESSKCEASLIEKNKDTVEENYQGYKCRRPA